MRKHVLITLLAFFILPLFLCSGSCSKEQTGYVIPGPNTNNNSGTGDNSGNNGSDNGNNSGGAITGKGGNLIVVSKAFRLN